MLIDLPEGSEVVGAFPRPPRMLTIGRRMSDRFVAYSLSGFLVCCSIFVLYVGWLCSNLDNDLRSGELPLCPATTIGATR